LIDGKKHVKRIAQETFMDIEIVKVCIQHLIFYQIVELIDIFQFSNIYAATENITSIAFDETLQ